MEVAVPLMEMVSMTSSPAALDTVTDGVPAVPPALADVPRGVEGSTRVNEAAAQTVESTAPEKVT
jgi:hypothetical protein